MASGTIKAVIASSDIVDNLTTNDATKVLSAKQGKVLNDQIANTQTVTVTGTMPSTVDTYKYMAYPTGFNPGNSVIVGVSVYNSNGAWYSNNPAITYMGDTVYGLRIKSSEAGFLEKSFGIVLMKIPT